LLFGSAVYLYIFLQKETKHQNTFTSRHTTCLGGNEYVDYKIEKSPLGGGVVQIFIKDKDTNQEKFSFQTENIIESYHPMELHKCAIYVIKEFNFDEKKHKPLPGYSVELWRYQYNDNGEGEKILAIAGEDNSGNFIVYYSYDFRIDPLERYLTLMKGYLGSSDYGIVIKGLKTLNDIFVLEMTEIERQHPEIVGNISFITGVGNIKYNGWSDGGRYFWVDTHYGAVRLGFIRIDTTNWKYEIFPAPQDVLGGDTLNVENGYITVHPGNVWIGIAEINEEEKERRRKEGIGTELYIENLITKERHFVDKTDEPLWYFKPKWLSDTELEYELPTGEKKIYKINE